jgi:hypothetical protein
VVTHGWPPLPRGVFAFDVPDRESLKTVVLDTNVVAEALLPNQPERSPRITVFERFATSGTAVVFSGLLEIELWEALSTTTGIRKG